MSLDDLTLVYYTANSIPTHFGENVRKALQETAGDIFPIISVSQIPINFGQNICIGKIGMSVWNLYRQVLAGCEAAHTPYVAMCEDDALYSLEHFTYFRPREFACNRNRWNVRTWDKRPLFSYRNRTVFSQFIARRENLIAALKERLALEHDPGANRWIHKYLGEPGRYDAVLGVTVREVEEFRTIRPNVVFDHLCGLQARHLAIRKRVGQEAALELPGWGKANEILLKFFGEADLQKQRTLGVEAHDELLEQRT